MPNGVCSRCGCRNFRCNGFGAVIRGIDKCIFGHQETAIRACDNCGHHENYHY